MIAQFYCNDCKRFFVQSVENGCYARCPQCSIMGGQPTDGVNVRIISDYNWRLEEPETPKTD
jgi:Zn finger protein HypA/HybF involved in hydrogenase expression